MARVRVHQHVNPLSPYYGQEPTPIDLAKVFADPDRSLHLDIGCARGRFLLGMAQSVPNNNYLGVEIREPLVDEANLIRDYYGLDNLHYSFCNAMLWLERLLADIPEGRLQVVTIQFPDPWFKNRHAKRRMVNAGLVEAVVNKLATGGKTFVQTDIEFLADEMLELFRGASDLIEEQISENPFPIKTEREKAVEDKSLPVYRSIFRKK